MNKVVHIIRTNKTFFLFIFLLAFSRTAFADWSKVPSGSMEPTIYPGDYVLVDKMAYGASVPFMNVKLWNSGSPERGDIITFVPPHTTDLFVKRVVGLPGDSVVIEDTNVVINNVQIQHQHISTNSSNTIFSESLDTITHDIQFRLDRPSSFHTLNIVVPKGKYFVMGDHRNDSVDSRYWGFVDEEKIMGKVNRLALSFSSERAFLSSVGMRIQ